MPITTKSEHDENGSFRSFRSLKQGSISGSARRFPDTACLLSDMCPRAVVLCSILRGLLLSAGSVSSMVANSCDMEKPAVPARLLAGEPIDVKSPIPGAYGRSSQPSDRRSITAPSTAEKAK